MRTVKRIFIFLLLLVFLLGLLPLVDGIIFKRGYLTLLDYNSHGKAQVQDYSMGWLSSTAKIFLPASDGKGGVTLDQTIYHGPFLINPLTNEREFKQAAIVTMVHLDPKTESYLAGTDTSNGVLQMTTLVTYSNHFTTQVQSPVFNIKVGSQGKLVFQGVSGTIDSTVENNFIKSSSTDLHLGAISGESNGISVAATPSTLRGEVTCPDAASLCSVSAESAFPLLQSVNAQGGTTKLTGLHFKTDSHNANNNYSNNFQFSFSSLVAPDYSTGASSLKISYDHLNAAEIRDLFNNLQQAQNQYTDLRSSQLAAAAALNAALPKIITPQSTFNEDLRITAPAGVLTATGKVFWPAGAAATATSSAELMLVANAQVKVRASVTLVNDIIKKMDEKKAAEEEAAALAMPAKPAVETPPPLITIDETKLPAYMEFRKEIDDLTNSKVISTQIQIVIYKMSDTHTPVRDFNNAVDAMLKSNQITYPVATNLRNGYLNFFDAQQKAILATVFAKPAANLRDLKAQIQSLAQIKVIPDDVANELIDLQQQSLAPEIYNVALAKFVAGNVIPAELETFLKASYDVINKDLSLNPEALNAPSAVAVAAAPAPAPVGEVQAEFDSYVKQGYIKQDLNDYVIDFEYKDGVITLNGVPLKNSK